VPIPSLSCAEPCSVYVEWERRWGVPVNDFAVKVYEWLFVVVGPLAIVLGAFFIATGFLAGAFLLIIGVGMSWLGWLRLIRFVRHLLELDRRVVSAGT
jgi:hypothetical protein